MDVSETVFDGSQNSAVKDVGEAKPNSWTKHSLRVQNYPARELEFKAGGKTNFSGRIRLILVGKRIYSVMTFYSPGNPHPEDSLKFFDGFSIHGEPEAPTPKPDGAHNLNNQA